LIRAVQDEKSNTNAKGNKFPYNILLITFIIANTPKKCYIGVRGNNMKRTLFLLLPVIILLGCPPYEDPTYRIYYHGNEFTSGKPPVDLQKYRTDETATLLGPGELKNNDCIFLGWRNYDELRFPGDNITINWDDINLYAVWDDGIDIPFSFTIVDGEVIITRYNEDYTHSINIPNTLQGKPGTAVGDNVFSNFAITAVSLPKGLKRIGIGAFASNEIAQITIPDSVESIKVMAFQNNSLKRITLGSGLKTIERYTFRNNLLVEITIPETITSIEAGAFQGNDIDRIKIGADVTIENDTAMGTYGESFRTYYKEEQLAGLYLYDDDNDTWERL
jgi:hypothetical protein